MMVRIKKLEDALEKAHGKEVINVEELCALFDVSRMTVWKWRSQKGWKKERIPHRVFHYGGRPLIIFYKEEVEDWAKRNGVMYAEEREVARRESARERRAKRSMMRAHKVYRDSALKRIRKVSKPDVAE